MRARRFRPEAGSGDVTNGQDGNPSPSPHTIDRCPGRRQRPFHSRYPVALLYSAILACTPGRSSAISFLSVAAPGCGRWKRGPSTAGDGRSLFRRRGRDGLHRPRAVVADEPRLPQRARRHLGVGRRHAGHGCCPAPSRVSGLEGSSPGSVAAETTYSGAPQRDGAGHGDPVIWHTGPGLIERSLRPGAP